MLHIYVNKIYYKNNNFIIKNNQYFVQSIREQPPLEENEEYASYDVESLFTNVLIHEIYTHNK